MNFNIVEGNAVFALATAILVWVYLVKTNIRRLYRVPLAAVGLVAGYVLASLNDKLATHDHTAIASQWWYENSGLAVFTLLLAVFPVVHYLQTKHEARAMRPMRRSHASIRAHR
jgi:hypothetical protein